MSGKNEQKPATELEGPAVHELAHNQAKSTSSSDDIEAAHPPAEKPAALTREYNAETARENGLEVDESRNVVFESVGNAFRSKGFVYVRDFGLIALLLGWWIPTIINPATRRRWIVATVWVWFFILLILFHNSRYLPKRPVARVLAKVWMTVLGRPWSMLTRTGKLGAGWAALAVLVFGTTYGLPQVDGSSYGQRTISLVGVALIYGILFATSHNHSAVAARTTILGIGFQFIIALFVFRTGAGLSLFSWIATAAADLLNQAVVGGAAFFWGDLIEKYYFFINTLTSILFFVALCVALFYLGVLTWVIRKMAWFATKTFGISGAEATVAVASPFIGQGENCVLVRPYVKRFTRSEFHQVLTSGFAAIAGSVLVAYINLGVSGTVLVTSSVMSIPASIAASKMRYPETQVSDTAGEVVDGKHEEEEGDKAHDFFDALNRGGVLGVKIAGVIFASVVVILSLLFVINGLLTYIGRSWYITEQDLTLQLMLGYLLWPLVFLLGVPKDDVLTASKLLATKVVANEFVAYSNLTGQVQRGLDPNSSPLSDRGFLIVSFMLCGFGNIGSQGINIGLLSILAPKRSSEIVRLCPSALVTGILVTLSSAAIAGIVAVPTAPVLPALTT